MQILNIGVDITTPTGKLMLTMFAGVAEFEREIMLECQHERIAKAKAEVQGPQAYSAGQGR